MDPGRVTVTSLYGATTVNALLLTSLDTDCFIGDV
jgi:hypothetical protein